MTNVFDPWSVGPIELASLPCELDMDQQMQVLIANDIRNRRKAILNGTGFDVLDAIATCAKYRLTMPKWLADEFLRRFNAVAYYEAASWDDAKAFGRPYPKGTQIARLRKDRSAGPLILSRVNRLLAKKETRIDDLLFEDVVKSFKSSPFESSECKRIYYEELKRYTDAELATLFPRIAARRRKSR